MRVRIYYEAKYGRVTGIVIIDDTDWNLTELINDNDDPYTTFDLTKENLEKYMDGACDVDLEAIQEAEIEGDL